MADHLSLDAALWWSAKGSVIVLLAIVMTTLLRHRPAALRHAVWATVVLCQLVIPLSDAFVPRRTFAVTVPERTFAVTIPARTFFQANLPAAIGRPRRAVPHAAESRPPVPLPFVFFLKLAATTAMLLSLFRLVAGTLRVWRIERNATPVEDGPWVGMLARQQNQPGSQRPRSIRLLVSRDIEMPMSWGIFRPAILLPTEALQWPAVLRRHVLLHELGHIRRGDALTQCLGQLAAALFWFNPLVRLAVRRMRFESENACDDYVLRDGVKPSLYAGTLLSLSAGCKLEMIPAFAALSMARRSELEQRVRALIHPQRDSSVRRPGLAATIAATILLVLPLAAIQRVPPPSQLLKPRLQTAAAAAPVCRPLLVPDAHFSQTSGELTREGRTTYYFFERPSAERCIEGSFNLDTRFTDDDVDLVPAPGLDALIRERVSGIDRAVTVTAPDGQLRYRYLRDGRPAAWDEGARAWYRSMMPEFVRRTSAGLDARERRILAHEGVSGVLSEISRIPDGDVRSDYLLELMTLRPPERLARAEVIRWAASALRGDEAAFAHFLAALAGREADQPAVRSAILSSVAALTDPSNRKVVLEGMAANRDSAARTAAVGAIELLPDSVWRRLLLEDTAPTFLGEPALTNAWLAAAGKIEHPEDRRILLAMLHAHGLPVATLGR